MIETMIHVWGVLFVCLCRSYSPTPAVQRPSLRHKVRAFGLNAREQLSPTGAVQTPNTPVRQERLEAPLAWLRWAGGLLALLVVPISP